MNQRQYDTTNYRYNLACCICFMFKHCENFVGSMRICGTNKCFFNVSTRIFFHGVPLKCTSERLARQLQSQEVVAGLLLVICRYIWPLSAYKFV